MGYRISIQENVYFDVILLRTLKSKTTILTCFTFSHAFSSSSWQPEGWFLTVSSDPPKEASPAGPNPLQPRDTPKIMKPQLQVQKCIHFSYHYKAICNKIRYRLCQEALWNVDSCLLVKLPRVKAKSVEFSSSDYLPDSMINIIFKLACNKGTFIHISIEKRLD